MFIFINGDNLPQQVVKIIEREDKLIKEEKELSEKYETALNLKNDQELKVINDKGEELYKKIRMHTAEKVMVMTMYVGQNRDYSYN
jgi:hypothetical protein